MQILTTLKAIAVYLLLLSMGTISKLIGFSQVIIFLIGLLTIILGISGMLGIGEFYFIYGKGWNCVKGIKE